MRRYKGRHLRWTVLFVVIAAALVVLVPSAIAVHDEAFQLDGDIAALTSTPCVAPSLSTCPAPAIKAPNGFDWDSFFQTGTTTDSAGTSGTPGGVPKAG